MAMTYRPYTRERIAVDGTVKSLSPVLYNNTAGAAGTVNTRKAAEARVQNVGSDSATYTVTGVDPVAGSVGELLAVGAVRELESYDEVRHFRVTQTTGATSLEVTFYN